MQFHQTTFSCIYLLLFREKLRFGVDVADGSHGMSSLLFIYFRGYTHLAIGPRLWLVYPFFSLKNKTEENFANEQVSIKNRKKDLILKTVAKKVAGWSRSPLVEYSLIDLAFR